MIPFHVKPRFLKRMPWFLRYKRKTFQKLILRESSKSNYFILLRTGYWNTSNIFSALFYLIFSTFSIYDLGGSHINFIIFVNYWEIFFSHIFNWCWNCERYLRLIFHISKIILFIHNDENKLSKLLKYFNLSIQSHNTLIAPAISGLTVNKSLICSLKKDTY